MFHVLKEWRHCNEYIRFSLSQIMHFEYCVISENIDAMLVCKIGMVIVGFSSDFELRPRSNIHGDRNIFWNGNINV
jgi:hypothetical protein